MRKSLSIDRLFFCARTALSQPLNSQYGKQVDQ